MKRIKLTDLIPDEHNANRHSERGVYMVNTSLAKLGAGRSIVVDKNGKIVAGNLTAEQAADLGIEDVIVVETTGNELVAVMRTDYDLDDPHGPARQYAYADNQAAAVSIDFDPQVIAADIEAGVELGDWFHDFELADMDAADPEQREHEARQTLAERFVVPPFSVLDARQGYWQERKAAWVSLGIESELGRGNDNLGMSHPETTSTIDFYSQKRELEAQLGQELTKDEAAELIARRGRLKNARAANRTRMALEPSDTLLREKPSADQAAKRDRKRSGLGRTFGQDLMRGEHVVGQRQAADTRSNLNGSPEKPDWAISTGTVLMAPGTSIFDPVLCELAYTWFCPPDGLILDPFAGGSVRGIVAAYLARYYVGVDLRPEQVAENRRQAEAIVLDDRAAWIVGNSLTDMPQDPVDFVFTCPPYYDLEIYSDDPADLSNYDDYAGFIADYRRIIAQAVDRLKPDRFACVVVGDIRDKAGNYRNFVGDTIAAFLDAGASLYNEAILVTAVGSLPIRVGKQFSGGRKLGKTHQNVLVFVKGDGKRAADACGPVTVDMRLITEDS